MPCFCLLRPGSTYAGDRYGITRGATGKRPAVDLWLGVMKTPDHLGDSQLLVVEVEHWRIKLDERTPLDLSPSDAAVFVQRVPPPLEPKAHPYFVIHVLRIIREVICRAVNQPSESTQIRRDVSPQTPIEEEFRRIV